MRDTVHRTLASGAWHGGDHFIFIRHVNETCPHKRALVTTSPRCIVATTACRKSGLLDQRHDNAHLHV
jgi:hypothetical protein